MNPYAGNPSENPPPGTDPNQTRYFPTQGEPPAQASPQSEYTPPTPPPSTGSAPPSGYAPPNTGAYQPAPRTGTPSYTVPAVRGDRDRNVLALILIAGGLLFLLGNLPFFPDFGDLILLAVGGVLMYAYFTTRQGYRIGFLIPGAILLGIGAGEVLGNIFFMRWLGGDITAVTMGLGFGLIWFFERKHWWALIPGSILVLGGLGSGGMIGSLWPLALIVLGIYLLYDHNRRRVH